MAAAVGVTPAAWDDLPDARTPVILLVARPRHRDGGVTSAWFSKTRRTHLQGPRSWGSSRLSARASRCSGQVSPSGRGPRARSVRCLPRGAFAKFVRNVSRNAEIRAN
jgi:hypothetical protein